MARVKLSRTLSTSSVNDQFAPKVVLLSLPAPPAPFPHWMLAEIHEQPQTLARTLGRYADGGRFREDAIAPVRHWLARQRRLLISGSGSSRHAGLVAEILIEDGSTLPVDVEYASEYSYRSPLARAHAGVVVISQSGETADTLQALRKGAEGGHTTLAITNAPDSTMAREADVSMPTEAGRELAIPATKSFTAQMLVLELLALLAGELHGGEPELERSLARLATLPELVGEQLAAWGREAEAAAAAFQEARSFLFLGRGIHFPMAREGALKLKESAYLHAEAYPSGELKHGPNALVDEGTPLVMLATVDHANPESVLRYAKTLQLMRDMRAQGAAVLAVANRGDKDVPALAQATIFVEPAGEPILAICEVIPLQLLAYHAAVNRGIDVDRPRNLVKAVVAE